MDSSYVNPSKTIAVQVFPGVVLQSLSGLVTRDQYERMLPMLEHPIIGDRYVQLIHVVPTSIGDLPDDEFRKCAADSLKRQSGRLAALAYVVAGEGFLASMARTVIAGVSLLSRSTHAEKVFSESLPAATWLASHSGARTLVPADVVRAVEELVRLNR
jgi:hypothetical protein